ncbi:fibronectin type III domain-containing protein [Rarobacter incanus]|uniref:fibronectin type III domain-containing protein n=1 Tax=Rarobacter incanus TaxID=153494 RepID=UPI00114FA310|nr:fibronectin type III domain-containing protein [Rarobacter incanus]
MSAVGAAGAAVSAAGAAGAAGSQTATEAVPQGSAQVGRITVEAVDGQRFTMKIDLPSPNLHKSVVMLVDQDRCPSGSGNAAGYPSRFPLAAKARTFAVTDNRGSQKRPPSPYRWSEEGFPNAHRAGESAFAAAEVGANGTVSLRARGTGFESGTEYCAIWMNQAAVVYQRSSDDELLPIVESTTEMTFDKILHVWSGEFLYSARIVKTGPAASEVALGEVTHESASLRWDPVPGAASYTVAWKPVDGDESMSTEVTDATVVLPGLTPSTEYLVTVTPVVDAITRGGRARLYFTTGPRLPDAPVLASKAAVGVTASFVASSDPAVQEFEAIWVSEKGAREVTTHQSNPIVRSDLAPNTGYSVAVRARNPSGLSPAATWEFVTGPLAPGNVAAAALPTGVQLRWDAAAGATGYRVAVGGTVREVDSTTTQITGLAPSTTYAYQVQAFNARGVGVIVKGSVRTTLALPAGITVSDATSSGARVSWNQPAPGVRYVLALRGHEGTWSSEGTFVNVTGLSPGRTYQGTVTATKPGEAPAVSTIAIRTTLATVVAIEVTKRGTTSVTLTWNSAGPAATYLVRVGARTFKVRGTRVTVKGLYPGTEYRATVTPAGRTASNPVSFTTKKMRPRVTLRAIGSRLLIRVSAVPKGTKVVVVDKRGRRNVTAGKRGVKQTVRGTRIKVRVASTDRTLALRVTYSAADVRSARRAR